MATKVIFHDECRLRCLDDVWLLQQKRNSVYLFNNCGATAVPQQQKTNGVPGHNEPKTMTLLMTIGQLHLLCGHNYIVLFVQRKCTCNFILSIQHDSNCNHLVFNYFNTY